MRARGIAGGMVMLTTVALMTTSAASATAAERSYSTAHFTVRWSDDGPVQPDPTDSDQDGVPDAIVRTAAAFEAARAFLLDDMGFQPPPTHGRYDVFVSAEDATGFTRTGVGGNGRSKPSFSVIPVSLVRLDAPIGDVKSLAVHEFFHAVQNGYDSGEEPWIKEATAAWMEGAFAPHAHHNARYLYAFVPHAELGLTSTEGFHEYGAFLFFQFVAERYLGDARAGISFVRELWEDMAVPEGFDDALDDGPLQALGRELDDLGVTFEDAWREFLLWNWQIRRFENGAAYARELRFERWPDARTVSVTRESCRIPAVATEDGAPALSGSYERFTLSVPHPQRARLTVLGEPGSVAVALIKLDEAPSVVHPLNFDSSGIGALDLFLTGDAASRVVLAFGNGLPVAQPRPLAYSVRLTAADEVLADGPVIPSSTVYGTGVIASGTVTCNGAPAPFAHILVTQTETASELTHSVETITDAFGRWSLVVHPEVNSTFAVRVTDPLLSEAASDSTPVNVEVAVNISLSSHEIGAGDPLTVSGNIAPVHRGPVVIEIRRPSGVWRTAAETVTDAGGGYSATFEFSSPGFWEVRARMPDIGDVDHAPGESGPQPVQVGES